jgi:membrane protein implicated in regulation of membrane protease activity
MHTFRRATEVLFVLTLAVLLAGGILFVAGQAIALAAGQGEWLTLLNDTIKTPLCSAASVCAVAGFLLSYKRRQPQEQPQKVDAR